MYNIIYSDCAKFKDASKLSSPIKIIIKSAIDEKLLLDPVKFGKPLRYNFKNCRSLRVGNYRTIYQIENTTIRILAIGHCKDCYNYERNKNRKY